VGVRPELAIVCVRSRAGRVAGPQGRVLRLAVQSVAAQVAGDRSRQEAILCQKWKAHSASVSALLVLTANGQGEHLGRVRFVQLIGSNLS
jgi:hypothetical protein